MHKTILLPTDFTIESLNLLQAAARLGHEKIHVVMYHSIRSTDSIVELLFFSQDKFMESVAGSRFFDAVNMIRNKYSSVIESWRLELFTGRTKSAFRNFVAGNGADLILIPDRYKFRTPHDRSDDPVRFVDPVMTGVRTIPWPRSMDHEADMLSGIFQFDTGSK